METAHALVKHCYFHSFLEAWQKIFLHSIRYVLINNFVFKIISYSHGFCVEITLLGVQCKYQKCHWH